MSTASSSFDPGPDVYTFESDGDGELRPPAKRASSAPSDGGSPFLDAAALLALWSLLVINDGTVHVIDSRPATDFSIGTPPGGVRFFAGLFEVVLGLGGLFVGLAALLGGARRAALTRALAALQAVLGAYVVVVHVFVVPGAAAAALDAAALPGLSLAQSRALAALGMLASLHFALALHGGHLAFALRLLRAAPHGAAQAAPGRWSGARVGALAWSANMGAAGLWTLATGLLVRVGGGDALDEAFRAGPSVGMLPGMTTWTGVVLMFWAAVGAIITLTRSAAPGFYLPVTGYVFLAALLNFTIVQLGLVEGADGGTVARHVGLVFVGVFIGPYFVQVAGREEQAKVLL